ncbi:MAG TPA: cyclic peptide export ABC transporter [Nostocaceae cyanobacterium]|nr:cyclic peptide export ABC transporter [Nostocaceae cyanobacterium]
MNLIYLLLKSSKISLFAAVFAGLVSGISNARLIALINQATHQDNNLLPSLMWSFIEIALIAVISRFCSEVLLIRLSQKFILETRLLLSQRILATNLQYLEKLGNHRLLAMLTDDIQTISSTVNYLPSFCIAVAVVLGCLIYLAWLSIIVFIGFIIVLTLGIFSYQFITQNAKHFLLLAREEQDQIFNYFKAITEGIKELKLNQKRRSFLLSELETSAGKYQNYNSLGMINFSIGLSWIQLLLFVMIGIIDFILPQLIEINYTVLSGYTIAILFLVVPLDAITNILPMLNKANIALAKIDSLNLGLASNLEVNIHPLTIAADFPAKLEMQQVSYTYRGEQEEINFKLEPINLSLYPEEIVFLIGGNGSGKSTIAKLMTSLYIPEGGNITFANQVIDEKNREWYRQQFSVIFSDFYLFDQLVGLDDFELDNKAQEYLIKLQLDHKVTVKNGKLSTTALSQGQRKRLALLNAYLEDRQFYIFDEWASDQDPLFKNIFYNQILPELKSKGKTVVVISHDDRYFHVADRTIKLDYGQIV